MTKHALVRNATSAEPTLIVFGRDRSGKPRASWFDAITEDRATKAAELMQMRVLKVVTDEQKAMARQLPQGRVFATGKALAPYTRPVLFTKLLDLARPAAGPSLVHSVNGDTKPHGVPETNKASPATPVSPKLPVNKVPPRSGSGPAAPFPQRTEPKIDQQREVARKRPTDWDRLSPGDLVLGRDADAEGWYECVITAINGDTLQLRWRDYEGTVICRRDQIALMHPGSQTLTAA